MLKHCKQFQKSFNLACFGRARLAGKKLMPSVNEATTIFLLPPPFAPRVTVICRTRANEFTEAHGCAPPAKRGCTASWIHKTLQIVSNLFQQQARNIVNSFNYISTPCSNIANSFKIVSKFSTDELQWFKVLSLRGSLRSSVASPSSA